DLVLAGPGVGEGLVVLDRTGVHDEAHLLGAALAVGLEDLRLLHLAGPVRIAGEVGDHPHDLGRCRLDRDARAGVFRHRRGSSRCGPVVGSPCTGSPRTPVQRKATAQRTGTTHPTWDVLAGSGGHHSRAQGRPVPAKCPTFTHSVAPTRIRRTSGWWTCPNSA